MGNKGGKDPILNKILLMLAAVVVLAGLYVLLVDTGPQSKGSSADTGGLTIENFCGDGTCDSGEDCNGCAADCGACPVLCGDGSCDPGEDCASCGADCGACDPCGDGVCALNESCLDCPADCGECAPGCGDGLCEVDETCRCPYDCGKCGTLNESGCGDGICGINESCASCRPDCGYCPHWCGDGICDSSENCLTCNPDCTCPEPDTTFTVRAFVTTERPVYSDLPLDPPSQVERDVRLDSNGWYGTLYLALFTDYPEETTCSIVELYDSAEESRFGAVLSPTYLPYNAYAAYTQLVFSRDDQPHQVTYAHTCTTESGLETSGEITISLRYLP